MNLIKKYNVAGPRYTSYPTVPYWDNTSFNNETWLASVKKSFLETNSSNGISLYIHLPFCESLCTYCGCNTRITVNHKVEQPYIAALLKEWKMYLKVVGELPKIKEIHLGGGTPTFFSSVNLKLLIKEILSSSIVCPNAEFSFEAHPNNTTREHLETLYSLGFKRLSLGIQDFDLNVQQIVNRIQSYENVERVVNEARSIGYTSINFDLIYGLPLQTKQSVSNTISQVNQLKPDRIAYYSYAHVPWIKPGQRKFTQNDLPVDEEKRALYELGKEQFITNGYTEIGMDHFALRSDTLHKVSEQQKLHRNFMGYTSSYTQLMIGLGVSSISDSWYAFAQNVKNIEEYYQLIEKDKFPVVKGHLLNSEDLILRKHILNLMCKFETSWEREEEQCTALYNSLERLHEMVKDDLIELSPFYLKVKPAARPFIRNVCMAFDDRLWQTVPKTQIFSSIV
jgi:oxygen-independent coproporphyrinogen III oxidase